MDTIEKIVTSIERIREFYGMDDSPIELMDFTEWPDIRSGRGIYIIVNDDEVLYVGKGNIKSRHESHFKKLTGQLTKHDNKEPRGWVHLRENRGVDHTKLQLVIVYLSNKADESAMEGGLIKMLQPYTNDEIFSENFKLGNI